MGTLKVINLVGRELSRIIHLFAELNPETVLAHGKKAYYPQSRNAASLVKSFARTRKNHQSHMTINQLINLLVTITLIELMVAIGLSVTLVDTG